MPGAALTQGGGSQQFAFLHSRRRQHAAHGKFAQGQGAGLVEHHGFGGAQPVHHVAALDQNAVAGRAANAAHKTYRDAEHQCAGAAHHQEHKPPVQPVAEGGPAGEKGRHKHDQRRKRHDRRRINPGELGDELFRLRLFVARLAHQIQDLLHGGIAVNGGHLCGQQAGKVYAAAGQRRAGRGGHRHTLAGQGAGIHSALTVGHGAVQRHPLAGADADELAHRHLAGVHPALAAVFIEHRKVRPNVHQAGDVFAAAAHGQILQQLAHPVKDDHGHRLGHIADSERPQRGHRHQKVFVKNSAAGDVFQRAPQDSVARQQVGRQVNRHGRPAGRKMPQHQQGNGPRHLPGSAHCLALFHPGPVVVAAAAAIIVAVLVPAAAFAAVAVAMLMLVAAVFPMPMLFMAVLLSVPTAAFLPRGRAVFVFVCFHRLLSLSLRVALFSLANWSMAAFSSSRVSSVSVPFTTQCSRCSVRISFATWVTALLTLESWVSRSPQGRPLCTISRMPFTWPLMRARRRVTSAECLQSDIFKSSCKSLCFVLSPLGVFLL